MSSFFFKNGLYIDKDDDVDERCGYFNKFRRKKKERRWVFNSYKLCATSQKAQSTFFQNRHGYNGSRFSTIELAEKENLKKNTLWIIVAEQQRACSVWSTQDVPTDK